MPNLKIIYGPNNKCVVDTTIDPKTAEVVSDSLGPCTWRDTDGNVTVRFRAEHAVPDTARFVIHNDLVRHPFGRIGVTTSQYMGSLPGCILLLLESPHRDEYGVLLEPLGPAVGNTGDNLRRHIELFREQVLAKLPGLDWRTPRPLVLVNAVPFPASCMVEPLDKALRARVFRPFLSELGAGALLAKLRAYSPSVVINGVTSEFRSDVGVLIDKHFEGVAVQKHVVKVDADRGFVEESNSPNPRKQSEFHIVNVPHPEGWHIKKDRN